MWLCIIFHLKSKFKIVSSGIKNQKGSVLGRSSTHWGPYKKSLLRGFSVPDGPRQGEDKGRVARHQHTGGYVTKIRYQ